MSESFLGHALVIANPAAHSGKGAEGARHIGRFLESYPSVVQGFEIRSTAAPGDALRWAGEADPFDTVIALGGDGVIHEVVNGLMALPCEARPKLGILPLGSGNDYARTLGMARNDIEKSFSQILHGQSRTAELGRVNGEYFMQTLSFGIDAAIALDTSDRRADGASQEGEALFVTSGLKIFSRAKEGWRCTARINQGEALHLDELIFAVQVGPTYGGGFPICPQATPFDGQLDVCYNVKRPHLPYLMTLFGLARVGLHVRSKVVRLRHASQVTLDFEEEPPAQADGEPVHGTHFEIEVVPEALRVIVP